MKKEISLKEMQNIELGILKYIKSVCEQNGLRYYLAYGTLIGAIRHQGFIPWDDDVDIMMPREDYNRFIEITNKNPDKIYKLMSYETCDEFTSFLPKVIDTRTTLIQNYGFIEKINLGVYVDIFVLDGIGNTYNEAVKNYKRIFNCFKKWLYCDTKMFTPNSKNYIKDILRFIRNSPYKFRSIRHYLDKLLESVKKINYDDSLYVCTTCLMYKDMKKCILLKSDIEKGNNTLFVNEYFTIPKNYDNLLKQHYGDYLKLPPESKRISNHNYEVFWK